MLIDAISPIKRLKGEKGQDIVEFALIFPILATILFGIIDFGWVFYSTAMVANATREGARFAVMNYKEADEKKGAGQTVTDYLKDDVTLNVKDSLPAYLKNSYSNLSVTVTETNVAADDTRIEVKVNSRIRLFTPVLSTITGSKDYSIRRTVSMKKVN